MKGWSTDFSLPPAPARQDGPQYRGKGPSWHTSDSQGTGSRSDPGRWLIHLCLSAALQKLFGEKRTRQRNTCELWEPRLRGRGFGKGWLAALLGHTAATVNGPAEETDSEETLPHSSDRPSPLETVSAAESKRVQTAQSRCREQKMLINLYAVHTCVYTPKTPLKAADRNADLFS